MLDRSRALAYCDDSLYSYYRQLAEEARDAARKDISTLSYFCLFRENIERPAREQLLMWSNYSDGLRGMRLEFDTSKLINSLRVKPGTVIAHPIQYVSEPPTVSTLDYLALLSDKLTLEAAARIIFSRVACKNEVWSYEQEYRLISHTHGGVEYCPSAVREIIFGEKMPDSQKRVIHKIFKAHGAETTFRVAKISRSNYEMLFEDYSG